MSSNTVYLVTGANRGIGFGIVQQLASRPNSLVFAAVRNLDKADALNAVAKEQGNVEVVKLEAPNEEDAKSVAKLIEEKAGKLDVVIANAGIGEHYTKLLDHKPEWFRSHFEVNALGPLVLFQQTYPLLVKSDKPKFLAVSSKYGSSTESGDVGFIAYCTSKAALNHIMAHAHHDYPEITSVALCPGPVATDMGSAAFRTMGLAEGPPLTVAGSAAKIVRLADEATRESHGGKYWSADEDRKIPY